MKNLSNSFSKSQPANLHTNDRVFLQQTHCFKALGHTEDSNEPIDPQDIQESAKKAGNSRKVILGDDLGSERYVNLFGKLDFCNIPFLRRYSDF